VYTGSLAATSNKIRWKYTVEVIDPITDTDVDLIGSTIVFGIRDFGQQQCRLTGSLADAHAVLTTTGKFDVTFTRSEMQQLPAGSYDFGMVLRLANGEEHQLFAGSLPVVDGVVENP